LLPGPVESRENIDWAAIHPSENVTRWMSINENKFHIELEPAAAVPDIAEQGAAADRGNGN
jgi:hypothetical protein